MKTNLLYISLRKLLFNFIRRTNEYNISFLKNHLLYELSVCRRTKINYIPPVLGVTVTENCNLRCPTCLYLLENPEQFKNKNIDVIKFSETLKKYNKKNIIKKIFLTGGEPLLHPNIEKIIEVCKQNKLQIFVATNGINVKKNLTVLKDTDNVNVSIDAYDYESYKKYRGGTQKQFDLLIEGLKTLEENNVKFSVSFLLSLENIFGIDKMINFASKFKTDIVSFHNINPHGCEEYKPLTFQDNKSLKYLKGVVSRTDYPFDISLPVIFDTENENFRKEKCKQPWYYFLFNSAGDVSYCCHLEHNADIGNVFSGYDFNSKKMLEFRKKIIDGKILKSCLFCQRRFMGKEFGIYNRWSKSWTLNN